MKCSINQSLAVHYPVLTGHCGRAARSTAPTVDEPGALVEIEQRRGIPGRLAAAHAMRIASRDCARQAGVGA
jgi:hypothetical protein